MSPIVKSESKTSLRRHRHNYHNLIIAAFVEADDAVDGNDADANADDADDGIGRCETDPTYVSVDQGPILDRFFIETFIKDRLNKKCLLSMAQGLLL